MINPTYHIYLQNNCLFKDLTEWEFNIIWRRIYKSYFTEDLTYEKVVEPDMVDASYWQSIDNRVWYDCNYNTLWLKDLQ